MNGKILRTWPATEAPSAPDAAVVAIHGLDGRADDFEPLGAMLAASNCILYSWELSGHGMHPDATSHGDLPDWRDWMEEARDVLDAVSKKHPGTPLILCGESMGGIIAINTVAELQNLPELSGLLLLSPVTEKKRPIHRWQDVILRWLMNRFPTLKVSPGKFVKPSDKAHPVSGLPEYENYLKNAPHKVKHFTLRFLDNLRTLCENCLPAAGRISIPTLTLYAGRDVFIKSEQTERFIKGLASADNRSRLFPEACHLLQYDPQTPEVLREIQNWLDDILEKHRSSTPSGG